MCLPATLPIVVNFPSVLTAPANSETWKRHRCVSWGGVEAAIVKCHTHSKYMHMHALSASYTKSVMHLMKEEVLSVLRLLAQNAARPYDPYGLLKVGPGGERLPQSY